MDIQTMIYRQVRVMRKAAFDKSGQLTIGQLIERLKQVKDKSAYVRFNFGHMRPKQIESWRGSYSELAIGYSEEGEKESVSDFIGRLKKCIGETFCGYKGGNYIMSENTPIWVANHGEAGDTAVFGVSDHNFFVVIETGYCDF